MAIYEKYQAANANTWFVELEGALISEGRVSETQVTVLFASGEEGETLSLCDVRAGIGLTIPFELVEGLIKRTREG